MSVSEHEQRQLDQGRQPDGWPTPPPSRTITPTALVGMWDDPNFCPTSLDFAVPSHDTVPTSCRPDDDFEVVACRTCGQRFINRDERGLYSLTDYADDNGQDPRIPGPEYYEGVASDFAYTRRLGLAKWSQAIDILVNGDVPEFEDWWRTKGTTLCSYCDRFKHAIWDCGDCPLFDNVNSDVCHPAWEDIAFEIDDTEEPNQHRLLRLTTRMYAAILLSEDPHAQ